MSLILCFCTSVPARKNWKVLFWLNSTSILAEAGGNSVEAWFHLIYTEEQLQKQRMTEHQCGFFRCSCFEGQGTKGSLYTRCEISSEQVELWRQDIRRTVLHRRTFFLFLQTLQLSATTSRLAQTLELLSSSELCRSNPTLTQGWESSQQPSLCFLHGDITHVCIPARRWHGLLSVWNNSGWVELQEVSRPTPCPKLVQLWGQSRLLRTWSSHVFETLQGWRWHSLSGQPTPLLVEESFPFISHLNLSCFHLCSLSLALPPYSTVRNPALSSQIPPPRHQKAVIRSYPKPTYHANGGNVDSSAVKSTGYS